MSARNFFSSARMSARAIWGIILRNRAGDDDNTKQERQDMTEEVTGTVKWFNDEKGFGFIGQGEGEPDVFVHYKNIVAEGRRTLREGQKVTMKVTNGAKGLSAENVKPM